MSSLIASRINSSDIILEFQIPAPSSVLPHWIDITRFRPDSHHYRTNMMSRQFRFHAEWWTPFTTIPWCDSKAGPKPQFRNRFLLLTSEAALSNYITGLAPGPLSDVCPLLVSPHNCPLRPQLAPVSSQPGDRYRCRSRQPRRRPGIANNGRRERKRRAQLRLWVQMSLGDSGPSSSPRDPVTSLMSRNFCPDIWQ